MPIALLQQSPRPFMPLLSKVTQLSSYIATSIMKKIAHQLTNTDTPIDTIQVLTQLKIDFLELRLWDLILLPYGTSDLSLGFSSHHMPINFFTLLASHNFYYLFLSLFLIR